MSAKYTVLAIPGTSESHLGDDRIDPYGMTGFVTRELDPAVFECQAVNYPSSFGYPMSEIESIQVCLKHLEEMIRATPLPVILVAYSQGAQVARQLLALLAANNATVADLEVVGAGFLADPYRNPGVNEGPRLDGYGLAGAGPAWPDNIPVWELSMQFDPISNSAPDSLLRPVADVLKFFTVTDPVKWAADMTRMVATGEYQRGDYTPTPESVLRAMADMQNYAVFGMHIKYGSALFPGTNRTFCQHLTDLINARFGGGD